MPKDLSSNSSSPANVAADPCLRGSRAFFLGRSGSYHKLTVRTVMRLSEYHGETHIKGAGLTKLRFSLLKRDSKSLGTGSDTVLSRFPCRAGTTQDFLRSSQLPPVGSAMR